MSLGQLQVIHQALDIVGHLRAVLADVVRLVTATVPTHVHRDHSEVASQFRQYAGHFPVDTGGDSIAVD